MSTPTPTHTAVQLPRLPDGLLNLLGEYSMAREDFGVGTPGALDVWQRLIAAIKEYAADQVKTAVLADRDSRPSSVAPGGQPLPQADEQSVFDAFPLHECLRLADLWTSGVDLNNEGQWRIVMKVLLDKLRAHGDSVLPTVEPPGATLSPCAASQWISVGERLPNEGQNIVFVVDCKNPTYDYLHGKVLGGYYRACPFSGGFSVPGMTVKASHWAPMLPPPQVDRGESSSEGGES